MNFSMSFLDILFSSVLARLLFGFVSCMVTLYVFVWLLFFIDIYRVYNIVINLEYNDDVIIMKEFISSVYYNSRYKHIFNPPDVHAVTL